MVGLKPEGDSMKLYFGDDPSVLRCGSWMLEDARAVVEVLSLDVDCPSVSNSGASSLC